MSSKNSRLQKPVPMHRNRGYWDRIIDADEVRGKHLKEKKGKQTLPVFEPKSLMDGFEYVYSLTDHTEGPNEGQT